MSNCLIFLSSNPKSILCIPIVNQQKLTGILYLENNLTTDAFTQERVEILKILSSQIAISIDNAKLYANLEDKVVERTAQLQSAKDALWGEMQLAKKIQTVLLPPKPKIKGFEISGYMEPADEVGGDYYDIINAAGKDWVVIGDVSGHGVPAGLIMMMVQTSINAVINQAPEINPTELLTSINGTIAKNIKRLGENKYMTLTVLAVHEDGRFVFSGLHQDILVYRANSKKVEEIETKGMWIGITEDLAGMLQDDQFKLELGDTVLLYTDGITEATDGNGNMFSDRKLRALFATLAQSTTEQAKEGIISAIENYHKADDVTLVIIKRIE